MKVDWRLILLTALAILIVRLPSGVRLMAQEEPVVKVFLLAGQSNMQGHGKVEADANRNDGMGSLEWLVTRSDSAAKYKSLLDDQGAWRSRDDVQIWYLDRSGWLAPGFGHQEGFIGPELGFGQVVGDAIDQPVLLIKLAWGGKSLAVDFRPPSSGGEVGPYYRELTQQAKHVIANVGELFPNLAGHRAELLGIGWHQGWNDRVNQAFNDEYEANLANFIRDIRDEFDAPALPFVIAETGMSGLQETHPRALSLMRAQAAVAEYAEFQSSVAFVATRAFYRPPEESPSGQSYHWNSNAETYFLIGEAMGQAMLPLIEPQ